MAESKEYKKFKCAVCDYEFTSRAIKPLCSKCGSRRSNQISQFSAIIQKTNEVQPMATKEEKPEENKKNEVEEELDDVDKDIWE